MSNNYGTMGQKATCNMAVGGMFSDGIFSILRVKKINIVKAINLSNNIIEVHI